jgi:hypothetical protein
MPDAFRPLIASPLPLAGRWQIGDARATLEPRGFVAHLLPTDATPTRTGMVMRFGDHLLAAFGPTQRVEIGAYRRTGDALAGLWVPPDAKVDDLRICGAERSKQSAEMTFTIERAHAVDQLPYTGTLRITPAPQSSAGGIVAARFNWTLHDGEYASFGLLDGDVYVSTFCFEKGARHGVGLYRADGDNWRGAMLWNDETTPRQDALRRLGSL